MKTKQFGHCFECGRLLPISKLEQVEYFDYHIGNGMWHHKILCQACVKKAEEAFKNYEQTKSNNNL